MTDNPTPEQIQRACDLANSKDGGRLWIASDYEHSGCIIALADTIAELDAEKARADKAVADLREIDRIAVAGDWGERSQQGIAQAVKAIAAKYRVETDPLLIEARAILADGNANKGYQYLDGSRDDYPDTIAVIKALKRGIELAKRGIEV